MNGVDHTALKSSTRRTFLRQLGLTGSLALAPATVERVVTASLRFDAQPSGTEEAFWSGVRSKFLMPSGFMTMNAANLCPPFAAVFEATYRATRELATEPSPMRREKIQVARETTRRTVADFLRVREDEIVLTRNTSESNNFISSGLSLTDADEVLIHSDNHPSNNAAWRDKSKRYGYRVTEVQQVNPHPGAEYYLEAFKKAITPKTRVLAVTHLTSTVGDLMPVKALCALARERGIVSVVDGAQSFGLLDVDLGDLQPDFYTASGHKWACGPLETGVLYINKAMTANLWPSILSATPGAVGMSQRFEALGQRDEPALAAFAEALSLQTSIGRQRIERRGHDLARNLQTELRRIEGVSVWTSPIPERSAAIVSFRPGNLDPRKLASALYQRDHLVCAVRGGDDRGGLRLSPHLYNSHAEVERVVKSVSQFMKTGV
jgi:isopenicillin-N epimerase